MNHPPPEATGVDPSTIDWAILRLQPPTERELRLAHRVGLDPNILIERFNEQYRVACAVDAATINLIVGDAEACGPVCSALWDYLNEFAIERHHEWWVAPVQNVAKVLNPRTTAGELDGIASMIRSAHGVGFTLTFTPTNASRSTAAPRQRQREHRPGASRRTASSSTTSSSDPGDSDGPGEPARLRIRRPSGATAVLTATSCTVGDGMVNAVGSWDDLPGIRVKSWRTRDVLDVTWLEVVA